MTDLFDIALLTGALTLLALLAGFASGLLGIGGGIFLVPAFLTLFSAFGFDGPNLMQICVGTSTACVLVNTSRAAYFHWLRGALDLALFRLWWPFIVAGAVIGVLLTRVISAESLALIFGCVGLFLGVSNVFAFPERGDAKEKEITLGCAVGLGGSVGLFSAMMGVGGGTLGVPAQRLLRRPMHRAVATSAAMGALLSLPATATQFLVGSPMGPLPPVTVGFVNVPAFVLVSLVSSFAIARGVSVAHRLGEKTLRWLFAIVIIALSLRVLLSV